VRWKLEVRLSLNPSEVTAGGQNKSALGKNGIV
jgi:hypothetical protein